MITDEERRSVESVTCRATRTELVTYTYGERGVPVGVFEERTFDEVEIGERVGIYFIAKHFGHGKFESEIDATGKLIFHAESNRNRESHMSVSGRGGKRRTKAKAHVRAPSAKTAICFAYTEGKEIAFATH